MDSPKGINALVLIGVYNELRESELVLGDHNLRRRVVCFKTAFLTFIYSKAKLSCKQF